MSVRKLPVYIVADCSGSMRGDPIESVKTGIGSLHANLTDDPSAVETAYLSIISFASAATQVVPLTEICDFTPPELKAGGMTSFGAALELLREWIKKEVRMTATEDHKADWRPLVFLLTDGAPTDEWESKAQEFRQSKIGNIIAVGCGGEADLKALKQVTDNVLHMKEMTPEGFKEFFKWVSASVVKTSHVFEAGSGSEDKNPENRVELPTGVCPIVTIAP